MTLGALLGGPLEVSWRVFGPLGSLVATSSALLGASSRLLGVSWSRRLDFTLSPSWASLGAVLGPSRAVLGASGTVLGPPGPSWCSLGSLLGCLGADIGASWAVLERRETEKARTRKSFKNYRQKSTIFASSGPLGRPLGRLLGRLGGLLDSLGLILG